MQTQDDEIKKLRRATREIISISSLPSIWVKYNVSQVADSVAETLQGSLSLSFAFVRFFGEQKQIESVYSRRGFLSATGLASFKEKIDPILQSLALEKKNFEFQDPFSEAMLQVAVLPIGYNFKNGTLVVGANRVNFPVDTERLVLNIAANQMSVKIQQEWAQEKTQSLLAIAEDKEKRLRETEAKLMIALQAAEMAKSEAVSANELKSSFLANMSHEIRTPLGAILGFTDVLKTPGLSAQERFEYLDIINRNGQSLTKIIDDILDLSKIEAGKLEIENLPISLTDLSRDVLQMFSDRAVGKGIELKFDSKNLPKFEIGSDQIRIRQILVNLIGNAIKFTSQGSIELSGGYAMTSAGQVQVTLSVKDTGVGMSPEVAKSLFQPFIQGDNTSTRRFGGTGLGLALSKKLGQALGGDVTLSHCEEQKGCTFAFEFLASMPTTSESQSAESKRAELVTGELLKGYEILVADDSVDNRHLMQIILKKKGATVVLAENGEDAIKKGMAGNFDVVLMDIQMPVLDGYGALAKLRRENFRKPIIALTAYAMKEERNRAIASGFVDHVSKPVNPRDLIDSILMHAKPSTRPALAMAEKQL